MVDLYAFKQAQLLLSLRIDAVRAKPDPLPLRVVSACRIALIAVSAVCLPFDRFPAQRFQFLVTFTRVSTEGYPQLGVVAVLDAPLAGISRNRRFNRVEIRVTLRLIVRRIEKHARDTQFDRW